MTAVILLVTAVVVLLCQVYTFTLKGISYHEV